MQIKKIITVTAATLLLTGAVVGAAVASSRHGSNRTLNSGKNTASELPEESSTPDIDAVEQGDQTGPETTDQAEASSSESGGEAETESGESDGPGGHEDPPGNVDHQFEGEE